MSKILVIEDSFEVRENLCEILALANYDVIQAKNGLEGVALAKEEKPDLILCDVMMPELDGFGVLKILNSDEDSFGTPFIFLTARTEMEDLRKGMGLGADDYITKPFQSVELLEAVEMRLTKSQHVDLDKRKKLTNQRTFFSEVRANKEFEKLLEDREVRSFKAKDVIYDVGHVPRWLYYVVHGDVKLSRVTDFGKELITRLYEGASFFGYYSLISGNAHVDCATALTETEVILIPKEDFLKILLNQQDFAVSFIKMMTQQIQETETRIVDMAYASVRYKIAQVLLQQCRSTEENRDVMIMTRDDLAAMVGTAKETLIRTLSDFKKEGLIAIEGLKILILKREELSRMSQ